MRKSNSYLTVGLIGLGISVGLEIVLGPGYNIWQYAIPWIAFIIIGLVKQKNVSKNES